MNRKTMTLALVAVLAVMMLVPVQYSDAADPSADLAVNVSSDTISISSSGTANYAVFVNNISADPTAQTYALTPAFQDNCNDTSYTIEARVNGEVVTLTDSQPVVIGPGDHAVFTVTISASRDLHTGDYAGTMTIYPYATSDPQTGLTPIVRTVSISATSLFTDDSMYNKILGVFPNTLPAPFDGPLSAAFITIVIWAIVALIISVVAVSVLGRVIIRSKKDRNQAEQENYAKLRSLWKSVFAIVLIFAIFDCVSIVGLDESIIVRVDDVIVVLIAIFGSKLVWDIYRAFIVEMGIRRDSADYASMTPLLLMIGRIVILFGAAVVILAVVGINLVSIITGLGLVATAISIGASSIISQFLSGLVILITRPFTVGDKIKVSTDGNELIVQKVNIMTTQFRDWNNEQVYIIPNSSLTGNKIVNITEDNVNYKVYDYFNVAYDTDITKAKQILYNCALENENVVTDGTFGLPDVKFYSVDRDSVVLRLSYFVTDHESYGIFAAQVRRAVFEKFEEEGIEIPYSQYTVNLDRTAITKAEDPDPDGLE